MAQSVLLTGAAGRVGDAILGDLAAEYEWRLMDRDPPTEDYPGEFVVADITDDDAVREAMDGIDASSTLLGTPGRPRRGTAS